MSLHVIGFDCQSFKGCSIGHGAYEYGIPRLALIGIGKKIQIARGS
jgi:hypothetical protein